MILDPQTAVVLGVLAAAGAALGAAIAHWRRGRSTMLTGAVIGMIALPILGYGAMLYAGVLIVLAIIGGLVTLGLGVSPSLHPGKLTATAPRITRVLSSVTVRLDGGVLGLSRSAEAMLPLR